ncbi:S49 family peptidase [Aestuariibius sp. 2305UL40-4]|uniref:S49 family peptidase n=1 Tax=Aestuariibius violaceus TaxID=3234132 RepID=UPI00345E6DBF
MRRWIPFVKTPPSVSVIRLSGAIGIGSRGLDGTVMRPVIEKAFRGKPEAIALEINSPGGSAVQSSLIASQIRQMAEEKEIPVVAFVEDVAASGGYWLATAADEIFVDHSSVVGSIGVISASFGAHEFIGRYGIERRVYTAGESKSMLDPFKPEKEEDVARLKRILDEIHETFKEQVRRRREGKLNGEDLFTGEIWVGQRAIEVGLADGIGHLLPEMKTRYGDKVRIRRFGRRRPLLGRLGAQLVDDTAAMLEERAAYARFGL